MYDSLVAGSTRNDDFERFMPPLVSYAMTRASFQRFILITVVSKSSADISSLTCFRVIAAGMRIRPTIMNTNLEKNIPAYLMGSCRPMSDPLVSDSEKRMGDVLIVTSMPEYKVFSFILYFCGGPLKFKKPAICSESHLEEINYIVLGL